MVNGRYHIHVKWHGQKVLVDAAKIDNKYEIMALGENGEEYDCVTVDTYDKIENAFSIMLRKFMNEPEILKGRYAKLRDDLIDALGVGKKAEESIHGDGGTCNFDGTGVYLSRWNHDMVRQAAKEAGTYAHNWDIGGGWWVFSPITHAQGVARTANADAVTATMGNKGYKVLGYYQMD